MASRPSILGVAEIVLNVRDLPKMRDFYRDVLGFELWSQACHETGVRPDPQGEPTIAFLTIRQIDTPLGNHGHPQLLALIDFRRHVFAKARFTGHEPSRSALNHLAFEIPPESYEDHQRRLEGLDLHPREATFPAMNARALFFEDPEQNLLELICHDPRAAGTADDGSSLPFPAGPCSVGIPRPSSPKTTGLRADVGALRPAPTGKGSHDGPMTDPPRGETGGRSMPAIHNLAETALFVAVLPRARDFYQRALGFEKVEESASGCVLSVAEGQVLLLVAEEKARIPSATPGGDVPACRAGAGGILGAGHVAFGVADAELDAWRAHLKSAGVKVLSEVAWERGARSLYFRDPDGHLLELVTPGLWKSDG